MGRRGMSAQERREYERLQERKKQRIKRDRMNIGKREDRILIGREDVKKNGEEVMTVTAPMQRM